jgi:2-polyprenyl-3-methyl-5-hydroxy-6-metoxy-1,4-benzoquinol methylase
MGANDFDRWKQEQEYFDNEEYSEGAIPANTIQRYKMCKKPFLFAEFRYAVLGDIRGKRVLEIGCGDGGNSVILALKGAHVVGIDISPRAIGIAKQRAKLHGVEDRTEFQASPLEAYLQQTSGEFDVICGFAILHHLLPVLSETLAQLKTRMHSKTIFMFAEPVALSTSLRRLRLSMPIKNHGTRLSESHGGFGPPQIGKTFPPTKSH